MEKNKKKFKSLANIIRALRLQHQFKVKVIDETEDKGYELNIKDMYEPGKSHPSLKNNFYKVTLNGKISGDSRGYSKADAHREINKMVNHPKNDGWFRKHKDLQENINEIDDPFNEWKNAVETHLKRPLKKEELPKARHHWEMEKSPIKGAMEFGYSEPRRSDEELHEDHKLHQKAGYHAYPYKSCPHKKGTKEHKHWWKGFFNRELDNAAKEQLEQIVYKLEEIEKGHKVTAIGKREGEEHIKGGKVEKRHGNMVHFRTIDGKLYKAHHTQLHRHEQVAGEMIKDFLEKKKGSVTDKSHKQMEPMKKISKQQNPFSRGFKMKSIKKLGEGEDHKEYGPFKDLDHVARLSQYHKEKGRTTKIKSTNGKHYLKVFNPTTPKQDEKS